MSAKVRRIDYSPDEWIAGTLVLTVEEEGLYSRLVARIYSRGGPLEMEGLAAYCRCDPRRFRRLLAGLERKGKVRIAGGTLAIDRCEIELRSARDRVKIAKNSAAKRWKPNGLADAKPDMLTINHHSKEEEAAASSPLLSAPPSLRSVGTGAAVTADAAVDPPDLVKAVWERGTALLGKQTSARNLIGKLRREYGDPAVLVALAACEAECISGNPIEFIIACLKHRSPGNGRNHRVSARENLWLGFAQAADAILIARLLQHYWTDNDPPIMRRAQAEDWIEDLAEFAVLDVQTACAEWRRTSTRKPMIADIRLLCIQAQQQRRERRGAGWDRDAYAREAGFENWNHRQQFIDRQQERYRLAEEWRNSDEGKAWAQNRWKL